MPRSHLHTTISPKSNEQFEELVKVYGTKSRVIEKAIETLLRVEKVGSCDDCPTKVRLREETDLKGSLDLVGIRRRTLEGLVKVALGEKTVSEIFEEQTKDAENIVEILRRSTGWRAPSNFKDFVVSLEQLMDLTRLFVVVSTKEVDNSVVIRPEAFMDLPELALQQMVAILRGLGVSFDLKFLGDDIVLRMTRPELGRLGKIDFDSTLRERLEKRLTEIAPASKNGMMMVGPAFMNWAEKRLEESPMALEAFLDDMRIVLKHELPSDPVEFLKAVLLACSKMNWLTRTTVDKSEGEFSISFSALTASTARVAAVSLSLILATKGWRLLRYGLEHKTVRMAFALRKAGEDTVLDEIAELGLDRAATEQLVDLVAVPREALNSLSSKLFESDRERFDAIFSTLGSGTANTLLALVNGDATKSLKIARSFIRWNLRAAQPEAEVRFVDDENFRIIFKKIDPVVMNGQRIFVESVFRHLGFEVSTSTFHNLLSFKLRRLERPVLEPVSKRASVQTLVGIMSAISEEEAFFLAKKHFDELFPKDYPWTVKEIGSRLVTSYRESGVEADLEYFEGGFTIRFVSCPYYKLVETGQKKWLCNVRKRALEYVVSRVTVRTGRPGRVKVIRSLLNGQHPCEYAIFIEESPVKQGV